MAVRPPLSIAVLRTLPAQGNRSMERYADEIVHGIGGYQDFEVTAVSVPPSALAQRLHLGGLDRRLSRAWRYPRLVRGLSADVFHIVDHVYADLAGSLPRGRCVATCHDLMLLRAEASDIGFRGRPAHVDRFRERVTHLRDVAQVVCVSEATKRDVRELLDIPEDRLTVAYNGISPAFRPLPAEGLATARAAALDGHCFAVLHVSTGDPYKNVEGTLEVLARLRRDGVDAVLWRIGRPLTAAQARLRDALGVADAVVEWGRVGDERLVELYNLADVLLFPSHYEGFGWPPLEAMACGTPVVTSDCPALAEVVADAGFTVPPRDFEALASAVARVLHEPGVADRLRARGLARAATFTWDRNIQALSDVYRAVAAAAG